MLQRTGLFLTVMLALAWTPSPASAHPGAGIVVDRAGNVYFVRAGQSVVWRRSPDGRVTRFVEDDIVRLPHHLALGRDGALYFASDFDGRIWRADSAGRLTEHFNTNRVTGHPKLFVAQWGDPWAIDSIGNVYALAEPNGAAVVRITPSGTLTPLALGAPFGPLHGSSMTVGADGALYLTDETRIWRVLGDSASPIAGAGTLEHAGGVAVAADGSVYVADFNGRRVVRLSRDGAVTTPPALAQLRLDYPWGVTIAPDGSLYILDHIASGRGVAIWRVEGDRAARLYVARSFSMFVPPMILTLVTLLFAAQTADRKPNGRVDWVVWVAIAGVIVGGAWWIGRSVWIFEWLRHAVLALWLFGAWRSWKRTASPTPTVVV